MTTIFMTIALGCGVVGTMMLTPNTTGIGIIGLGCLAGILARLNQAHYDQKKQLKAIYEQNTKKEYN